MNRQPVDAALLSRSVVALPPLARGAEARPDLEQNRRIAAYIESGGIRVLLYGTQALVPHVRPTEYGALLDLLEAAAGPETTVIPAIGPTHGLLLEQAEVLRGRDFPTAQLLPCPDMGSAGAVERAVGEAVAALGKPVVLTVTEPGPLTPPVVGRLAERGLVSFVIYDVERDDPAEDPLLRELVQTVDPRLVVSGRGEAVAVVHLREFGLGSFASGCAAVASRLSQSLLEAIRAGEWVEAGELRGLFRKLEDLRRKLDPVAVLHEAIGFAGIADMGPLPPVLTPVNERYLSRVREAAQSLHAEEIAD
jgi:dihydrodipicolinate synthase/N-acetylneuraminate lyase